MGYVYFTVFVFLTFAVGLLPAQAGEYYASPSGDDSNDCMTAQTPCKSAQAAVLKMPPGSHGLGLAPGTYSETIDVTHGRQVYIYSSLNGYGPCQNANLRTRRAATSPALWWPSAPTFSKRTSGLSRLFNAVFSRPVSTGCVYR
jgi:hypothetical protein